MITFTITGDTIGVSDGEKSYIEKRFRSFDKFVSDGHAHEMTVTASKNSAHARENSVRVEVRFNLQGKDFFAIGEAGDVRAAADIAKEELMREVTHAKSKRQTLFHRGARRLKSLLRGGRK